MRSKVYCPGCNRELFFRKSIKYGGVEDHLSSPYSSPYHAPFKNVDLAPGIIYAPYIPLNVNVNVNVNFNFLRVGREEWKSYTDNLCLFFTDYMYEEFRKDNFIFKKPVLNDMSDVADFVNEFNLNYYAREEQAF